MNKETLEKGTELYARVVDIEKKIKSLEEIEQKISQGATYSLNIEGTYSSDNLPSTWIKNVDFQKKVIMSAREFYSDILQNLKEEFENL